MFVFLALTVYSLACLCTGEIILRGLIRTHPNHSTPGKKTEYHEGNVRKFLYDLSLSPGTQLTTAYLLGQGILANIWLLLAINGWFSPILVNTIVFSGAIIGIALTHKLIFEFIRQLHDEFKEITKDSWGWRLISILTILLCLAWVTSIGRSPKGDGSGFYLPIAKVTSDSHRLAPLPGFEDFTSIGLQGEMHYAALMTLGSPGAAQLFSWPTILAGAWMLLALAGKVGLERRGQWLVAGMLFTSSAVIELSGSGKTDLFAVALGFSAYYWAVRIRDSNHPLVYWLTGLFVGLATVAKISYVLTLIPSIVIISLWGIYPRSPGRGEQGIKSKETLNYILIIMAGVLAAVIPHLVKNHVLFDNPIAPIGTGTTGILDQTWYGPETTRRILFTLPLSLTFGSHWGQMGNLSPLILAFSPLILLLRKPRRLLFSPIIILSISAVIGMTLWFVLRPSVLGPRYFLACLFLFAIPVARSTELYISNKPGSAILNHTITLVTISTLIFTGLYYHDRVFFPKKSVLYLTGGLSECGKELENCGMMTIINDLARPGDRLFTNTYLRYWFRTDLIQCALTTDEMTAYQELDTADQRWAYIYGRGFRFIPILNYSLRGEIFNPEDMALLPGWLSVAKIEDEKNTLLMLTSRDPSRKPVVGCRQTNTPAWSLYYIFETPIY